MSSAWKTNGIQVYVKYAKYGVISEVRKPACSGVSNADLMSNLTVVMNASTLTGASHVKPHVYIACTFTHITCNGNV